MAADGKLQAGGDSKRHPVATQSGTGFAYVLAMIGAAVWWVQEASGFGEVVVALLKSVVWPSFLVYELLKYIGA
jgi:hypothetical protein